MINFYTGPNKLNLLSRNTLFHLRKLMLVAILAVLGGCKTPPSGMLGVKWGDNASKVATSLGMVCNTWEPWEGGHAFSTCFDTTSKARFFGEEAYVRLFQKDGQLVGLSLRFLKCDDHQIQSLRDAVRKEFHLKGSANENPYEIFSNHALVHFSQARSDMTCTLTVAGSTFGADFEKYLLAQGLSNLSRELRPN